MTWETNLTIFAGLVTLALLIQGAALLIIALKLRDLAARMEALSAKLTAQIDSLAAQANNFLDIARSTAEKIHAVQENVSAISKIVHDRVVDVDAFLDEATDVARLQLAKMQDVLDTTSRRIDQTIDVLQTAIIAPVSEVQAVVRGIRTGLEVLFGWSRRFSRRSVQEDEEMFI